MKIAIPTRDNHVDDHFGHCAYYTIMEINDDKEIVATSKLNSPQGCGCKSNIASTLHNIGVTVMLAGNIGQGAINKLSESDIIVIRGCNGEVNDLTNRYLAGEVMDNAVVCDHHDCNDNKKEIDLSTITFSHEK